MAETSGNAVTVEDVQARVQTLLRSVRRGPPEWVKHDLNFGQLRLLFLIGGPEPVTIGQLAELVGVTPATASELVDRVERRGLVARRHRDDDRRVVECLLTEEGARLLAQIGGARQQATLRILSVLTDEELVVFDQLLRKMLDRLAAIADQA